MNVHCTWRFAVSSDGAPLDCLPALDRVMERLLEIESIDLHLSDSAVAFDAAAGMAEVSIESDGSTLEEALAQADDAVRSAIHAAGGSTPNWASQRKSVESGNSVTFTHGHLLVS